MGAIVVIGLLLLPLFEIAGFILVGGQIGVLSTLGAIVLTAVAGLAIVRWQGTGLLVEARAMTARGEVPARQYADGMLLALAGLLLLVPGFLSDLIGFLLLIPPVRGAIFAALSRKLVVVKTYRPGGAGRDPRAIDLDPEDYR